MLWPVLALLYGPYVVCVTIVLFLLSSGQMIENQNVIKTHVATIQSEENGRKNINMHTIMKTTMKMIKNEKMIVMEKL